MEKPKDSSVSIKVTGRYTTTGTQTAEEFDSQIEKDITKVLSQVLISGKDKPELFNNETLGLIENSFPNFSKATSNTVDVVFNYFNNKNEDEKLVVVSFTQNVRLGSKQLSNSGKIYFDTKGNIIGYNIPDQTNSQKAA